MNDATRNEVAAVRTSLRGKTRAQQVAILEARAKRLIEGAVGRPCMSVTIGDVIVTEWASAEDATLAADFFGTVMSKVTRLSYDTDLGWVCEAAESFS